MAVTTIDGATAALAGAQQRWPLHKTGITPQAAGCFTSLWLVAGTPGAPSAPAPGVGGAIPTSATAGAIPFTNPTGGNLSYLTAYDVWSNQLGVLYVYDRLWHNSGLSPTTLTAQTVTSTTLTRPDSTGKGVEAWFEVYTTLGAGSTAPTISYTDQDGNASNTGTLQNFATTAAASRAFRFGLAAGDTGVRSIQTYTNGATMTSGTFGLVLRRLIKQVNIGFSSQGAALDAFGVGFPLVSDDACLEFVWLANAASALTCGGQVAISQG